MKDSWPLFEQLERSSRWTDICGITAVYNETFPAPNAAAFKVARMTDALTHRGPDDKGIWVDKVNRSVALGNCRLAIIDTSPAGHQPMVDRETGTVVTFNGELYNYKDLRASLNYPWENQTDTECLLAGWRKWGIDTPRRLRGMFAFVLYSGGKLYLCRDRFGLKPLYWARTSEGTWLVASETRAIRAVAKFELNWTALAAYLRLGSVPSPLTAFQGIHELSSGHIAVIDGDGITERPYWQLEPKESHKTAPPGDSVGRGDGGIPPLKNLFQDAVRSHLQADVPIALFTGGGSDSYAIAKTASAFGGITGLHIIGDPHDFQNAVNIAGRYKMQITAEQIVPTRTDLDQFIAAMDQPSIDGTNTWFAARLAKKSSFKVALSGVGGDELFGGYKTFRQVPMIQTLQRAVPEGWAEHFGGSGNRMIDAFEGKRTLKTAYAAARGVFSKQETVALTGGTLQQAAYELDINDVLPNGKDVREMELRAYLHNQLLRDTDIMSMAHGVEVRAPVLDNPFAEAALAHPITRKQFCRILDLPSPGPKRGFSLPIGDWLAGPWKTDLRDLGMFHERPLTYYVDRRHWSRQWALTVLALWLLKNA